MLKINRGPNEIFYVVARAQLDNVDEYESSEEPTAIYLFDSENKFGNLIEKHIGIFAELPADEWMWHDEKIVFGSYHSEYMIAVCGTEFLFNSDVIPVNGTSEQRSRVVSLTLKNEYEYYACKQVICTPAEFYTLEDTSESWITLSIDGANFSSSATIDEVPAGATTSLYAKITIPEGTTVFNYRNLGIELNYAIMLEEGA